LCIFVDVFFFAAWKQIPEARLRPPLRLLRVEVDDVAHDTGWVDAKMFLARHPHNEDTDLTIRSESGSE
jgi:predicted component of type VI protein secretion system